MKVGVLAIMASFLLAAGLPLGAFAGAAGTDVDNDTVLDSMDNCVTVPNAGAQFCDTDTDGYGNACDADVNNDGIIGVPDFTTFSNNFNTTGSQDSDFNCDAVVGVPDFTTFSNGFNGTPGPSGLSCAGSPPCS